MAKYLDAIRNIVRQMIRDEITEDVTPDFADDEIDRHINECLIEVSQRNPYQVKETKKTSNRTGTATATSASHLVDTTNSQFTSSDVGRTVYNSTDGTSATVTAYNSTSDLTLGTDIMASGETYYIFNYGGTSGRDLDISEVTDLIEVEKAEYKTRRHPQNFRNVKVFGDVLTLDVDSEPDDDEEVFLFCRKVHSLTESASSLSPQLEKVLVEGVVAKAAQSWCAEQKRKDIVPASVQQHQDWADKQMALYLNDLNLITKKRVWEFYSPY